MKKVMRRGMRLSVYLLMLLGLLFGYGTWALQRPLPSVPAIIAAPAFSGTVVNSTLAWPEVGQAAVGIAGTPILEIKGPRTAVPIASAAKMITALTVLRQKPLKPSEMGPTITLSTKDAALYNVYVAQHGSVLTVTNGERISEYQMLQAILLPSANNMADSLAIWAFGSLPSYTAAANSYISDLGLAHTHIGADASGLAPNTTSTAQDLVVLGKMAMQNSVMAQIVGQSSASGLPIVNNVKNVNFLLGSHNIVGIKTGNTDEAGGVFVGAARTMVNHKPVTIVTAIVGAPTLFSAMKTSAALIDSAQTNFRPIPVITKGIAVGHYDLPWGGSVSAITSRDLSVTTWSSSTVPSTVKLRSLTTGAIAGQTTGSLITPETVITPEQSIPVTLQTTPAKPTPWWRLTHPLN